MKGFFVNFWNNFKNQPDIWFFFGFLLTFTLSIRKVLFYFPLQEAFNEYSATYIYLSDIFLILTFIFWLMSILCNISLSLSSIKLWITRVLHNTYILLPLFLVFLSFLSILWSQNVSIATFRSIKLLEFYLLYIYIIFRIVPQLFYACPPENCSASICDNNVPRGTLFNEKQESTFDCSTWNIFGRVEQFWAGGTIWLFFNIIILSSLFQSIIGIIQFFLQKSISLFWLKESLILPEILGVAKIILNGETYIRSYGLMPHPNVLGGFLLFSIIITLLYKKLFHACPPKNCSASICDNNVPRGTLFNEKQESTFDCSTWNIFGRVEQFWIIENISIFRLILPPHQKIISRYYEFIKIFLKKIKKPLLKAFWCGGVAIQILALILTFSKSAIIGLLIALVYIFTPFSFIRRRAEDEVKLFHVEHFKPTILSILIILASTFIIIKPDLDSLFLNSLNERLFYLNVPRGTFESDPVFGLGAGQSVLSMQKYFPQKLELWQYQPVHNVFLLIFSELGLVGFGLFIWWLWKLFHLPHRQTSVEQWQKNNEYILHNDSAYLSSIIISRYFKGILLGLIFIMLFDHYLWDIQQGSLLFWLTAGFIAGINRK